jgi:hypothetical protein
MLTIKFHVFTGYRDYMRESGVEQLLEDAGHRIADAAGGEDAGFVVDVQSRAGRRQVPRVSVRTATPEAMEAEAKDRVLTRALDAGRG